MSQFPQPAARVVVPVPAGTTAETALRAAGVPVDGPTGAVAVRSLPGRELRDLVWAPDVAAEVEPVPLDSPAGRDVLRHSTAHVLAQAVQGLFPGTLLGIGPPIEDGFYYDFLPERPFQQDDLAAIERRMREIVSADQRFVRRPVTDDEARAELAGERFKLELIDLRGGPGDVADGASAEVGAGQLTLYDNVDAATGGRVWTDLCRGPHLPSTGRIPAFTLTRPAAAYWRGSERNPQLQRIYGTAWESAGALAEHLRLLAEAEKRDTRRRGAVLDLFSFPAEIGGGLAVWHPKGAIVRRVMEEYARQRHEQGGYQFAVTPHLAKSTLFDISGHLQWYGDDMYPPMHMEGADYYPKPMNCPFHILIFRSRGRSYRELPLRLFELGTVYRFEKSGVLRGLTRARGFTQDDSHIFCTPDQLADELASLLGFVLDLLRDFGLTDFEADLATRKDDVVGSPEQWDHAEAALKEALVKAGIPYVVAPGEATFYAPKIDVHVRDAIGRRWQLSTLQVDLQLPMRFELQFQASDGTRQQPYMIHRALFGSVERFFGILTEHYAGAFPAWLAPVQAVGVPVTDAHVPYLTVLADRLRTAGIRVEVDDSDDRMQKKIRTAARRKVPYVLIAGDGDVAGGSVSFRYRDGSQRNGVPLPQAIEDIVAHVRRRENADPTAG
ncbi:MAG: threonyl-tRNA synthetase [Mycobacteriales bacterium]